jgi:hypothetical protein
MWFGDFARFNFTSGSIAFELRVATLRVACNGSGLLDALPFKIDFDGCHGANQR